MTAYLLPGLYALFLWWFSTGIIIYLDHLPPATFRWTMLGASIVAIGGLWLVAASSDSDTVGGAYAAFSGALLLWGWIEVSFYTGWVTGPRPAPCAHGCKGWRHFGHALQANLYHELAIFVLGAAVYAATAGAANQIGFWTFVLLAGMHESARLNVLLGVGNFDESFLPEHLAFLGSFIARKPINLLFPVSVTAATILTWILVQLAAAAEPAAAAGLTFLVALSLLALIEHWILVLPLRAMGPWQWSLNPQARQNTGETRAGDAKIVPHPAMLPGNGGREPPTTRDRRPRGVATIELRNGAVPAARS